MFRSKVILDNCNVHYDGGRVGKSEESCNIAPLYNWVGGWVRPHMQFQAPSGAYAYAYAYACPGAAATVVFYSKLQLYSCYIEYVIFVIGGGGWWVVVGGGCGCGW